MRTGIVRDTRTAKKTRAASAAALSLCALLRAHGRVVAEQQGPTSSRTGPDLAKALLGPAGRAPLPAGPRARHDTARADSLAARKEKKRQALEKKEAEKKEAEERVAAFVSRRPSPEAPTSCRRCLA